jgi:ATP-binding protein involved in chromosome partitioning
MAFEKKDIEEVLATLTPPGGGKNLIASDAVKSIQIADKKVSIAIEITNPSLQAKKKMEVEIMKSIHNQIDTKIDVVVKVTAVHTIQEGRPKKPKIAGIKNIIAIASGKGGVGKSTVTSNLAISLKKMGFSVGILDADIYGPSIPIMFNIPDAKPLSVNVGGSRKMKPVESHGIKILSLGFFTNSNQAVIWRGPMASKALNELIFNAHWGDLDFLLIDLPPGTGDIHLSIVQSVPITGAVIVSTPQKIALADAQKGVAMFQQHTINVPVLGVVENMSYFTPEELPNNKYYLFGKNGLKDLALKLKIPFLGEVPLIQAIREASDNGAPIVLDKNSITQQRFKEITQEMLSQLLKRNDELPPTEVVRITNMSGCKSVRDDE